MDTEIINPAAIPPEIHQLSEIIYELVRDHDPNRIQEVTVVEVAFPRAKSSEDITCTRAVIAMNTAQGLLFVLLGLLGEAKLAQKLAASRFPENQKQFEELMEDLNWVRKRVGYMRQSQGRTQVITQLLREFTRCVVATASCINQAHTPEGWKFAVSSATYALGLVKIATMLEAQIKSMDQDAAMAYATKTLIDTGILILKEWVTAGFLPDEI